MGSVLVLGTRASPSSRSTTTPPSMGPTSSVASSSWPKAWRKSWRTRGTTWILTTCHFTDSSVTSSPGSTCWRLVWRTLSDGNVPGSRLHPNCPRTSLRGSSGVTLSSRHPGTIWSGWRIHSESKCQSSIRKMFSQQNLTNTWRGVTSSCNYFCLSYGYIKS